MKKEKSTKEKLTKEIRVVVPPSLYNEFEKRCKEQYKTISEVIRDLMFRWNKGDIK